jgi:phage tail-like protein
MRFEVTLDETKINLGSWTKVEGLDVTWEYCEYRAGDKGNYRWYVPGIAKFTTLKLTRAVTKEETPKVKEFLDKNSFGYLKSAGGYQGSGGKLTILGPDHKEVCSWELKDVMIVKWQIAGFDATQSKIATETIEIQHQGFVEVEGPK